MNYLVEGCRRRARPAAAVGCCPLIVSLQGQPSFDSFDSHWIVTIGFEEFGGRPNCLNPINLLHSSCAPDVVDCFLAIYSIALIRFRIFAFDYLLLASAAASVVFQLFVASRRDGTAPDCPQAD